MKKVLSKIAIFILVSLFWIAGSGFTMPIDSIHENYNENYNETNKQSEIPNLISKDAGGFNPLDEKIYAEATIDEDFCDNSIMVVLKKNASIKSSSSEYRNERIFNGIKVKSINDLTAFPENFVTANGDINAKNAPALAEHFEKTSFRQILHIELGQASKQNVLDAIKQVEKMSDVMYVGPNRILTGGATNPDDPKYRDGTQWGLNKINASGAWGITSGSSNVRVGVIDSGIASHDDLNGNVVTGWDFRTIDPNTGTFSRTLRQDIGGHGTGVAGVLGAVGNNGEGITGVAQNVSLVPLQTAKNTSGSGSHNINDIVAAIEHATNLWETSQRIDILNLSVSGFGTEIDILVAIEQFPGLSVWAAGNEGDNIDKLSNAWRFRNVPKLISVGGSDANDSGGYLSHLWCLFGEVHWGCKWIGFSYGETTVDIYAPAYGIYTTSPGNNYRSSVEGTTFAAPHIAGVAALIKSKYPAMGPAQIKAAIMAGVDKIPALSDRCVSGGRLNAFKALHAAEGILWSQPTFTSNTNTAGTITASGQYVNEAPWRAFNGTLLGSHGGNGDEWSVNATAGFIQLKLNYYITVHGIEFYNGCSSASHRTKDARFIGKNGVPLGNPFTAQNKNHGYSYIPVNNVLTNVIQLSISSSYDSYVGAAGIVIHATKPASQPSDNYWSQPIWTANSNPHGALTASGEYSNEYRWRAYNGNIFGGAGGDGDVWSVKAKSGWLQLTLNTQIRVYAIEIWGDCSSASNRTKDFYFSGSGGTNDMLGASQTFANKDLEYRYIPVDLANGKMTNVIRLNITSSYGSYVGASFIKIHAAM